MCDQKQFCNISSTLSYTSPYVLEHYARKEDIQACLNTHPGKTAAQCACHLSGVHEVVNQSASTETDQYWSANIAACEVGYTTSAQQKGQSNHYAWCLANNPHNTRDDPKVMNRHSAWTVGCVSAITGV